MLDENTRSTRLYSAIAKVVITIILVLVFQNKLLRYEEIAAQILEYYIPILSGSILFLICLFHKGGGWSIRIAGLFEGISTTLLFGIVLWFGYRGVLTVGNVLYANGMEMLNADNSVLYAIGFPVFMSLLMTLPFLILAIIFRIVQSIIHDYEKSDWLGYTNFVFLSSLMFFGLYLFYAALLIFHTNSVGEVIGVGLLFGFLIICIDLGFLSLSLRILV